MVFAALMYVTLTGGWTMLRHFSFFLIIAFFFGQLHAIEQEPRTVTIWVHGSRTLSRFIFPTFFHVIPGLHRAQDYSEENNLYTIATALSASDPTTFRLEDVYLFGWPGTLGFKARQQAALQLYNQLIKLKNRYKKQDGFTPRLRIITHSHGGTIVQLLPTIETEKENSGNFCYFTAASKRLSNG